MIRPVGDPFASWQWKTRLGGGGEVMIGDGIICCWCIGCISWPFWVTTGAPFVGELAFDDGFLLNNGIFTIHLRLFSQLWMAHDTITKANTSQRTKLRKTKKTLWIFFHFVTDVIFSLASLLFCDYKFFTLNLFFSSHDKWARSTNTHEQVEIELHDLTLFLQPNWSSR